MARTCGLNYLDTSRLDIITSTSQHWTPSLLHSTDGLRPIVLSWIPVELCLRWRAFSLGSRVFFSVEYLSPIVSSSTGTPESGVSIRAWTYFFHGSISSSLLQYDIDLVINWNDTDLVILVHSSTTFDSAAFEYIFRFIVHNKWTGLVREIRTDSARCDERCLL